jgi:hypothetical protein
VENTPEAGMPDSRHGPREGAGAGTFGRRNRLRQGFTRDRQRADSVISKLTERSWNVYENKGPLWKTLSEAGMLLKTKVVIRFKSASY